MFTNRLNCLRHGCTCHIRLIRPDNDLALQALAAAAVSVLAAPCSITVTTALNQCNHPITGITVARFKDSVCAAGSYSAKKPDRFTSQLKPPCTTEGVDEPRGVVDYSYDVSNASTIQLVSTWDSIWAAEWWVAITGLNTNLGNLHRNKTFFSSLLCFLLSSLT